MLLRRCIFIILIFRTRASGIIRTHFPGVEDKLLGAAVSAFEIRSIRNLRKKPGTSGCWIGWMHLQRRDFQGKSLRKGCRFQGVVEKDEDLDALKSIVFYKERGYVWGPFVV